MPMKRIVGWGFVVMLWALVSIPVLAADKSDVAARAATWEKEYNAGNLAAVVALYAPDGCRMPPNQEAVHGRDAILAQLKAGKDRGFAQVKIASLPQTAAATSATAPGRMWSRALTVPMLTTANGCWPRRR